MRRIGDIDKIQKIEKLLKAEGAKVRKTTGNRGDYNGMGVDEPSGKKIIGLNFPVNLVATFEYDERTGQGAIRIKDDNLGRMCTRVKGLMEALSGLEEQPSNN